MAQQNQQTKLMAAARAQGSFNPTKMAEIIFGSKEAVTLHNAAYQRVEAALGTTDTMKLPPTYTGIDRQALFLEGLRAGKATFEDGVDNVCDRFHNISHLGALGNSNPFGLTHFLMLPMIKLQATDEQIAYWVPLAEQGEIVGSYTQTELGHGSFVGGVETTATFDRESDEFVIHSPTLTSSKYWPGGIGFASSHTVLMARLVIDGRDFGVHGFMVQLRSLKDWKPMPGIELGDIGLKMSYNGTDNGYAIFDHVRIPRTNLLMRHCTVTRNGEYSASPIRQKLVYGGMLNGRSIMARHAAFQLAQALTIATRYSTVREQGPPSLGVGNEKAIIHYTHQHSRLLSLIAKSYVIILASKSLDGIYTALLNHQKRGYFTMLPYNHMLMCGMKAWATQTASDGAEEARKMCGGHGYLLMSGLPEIVNSVTATCTFEGENFVMWGQVAKYLLKGMDKANMPADMAYLGFGPGVFAMCIAQGEQFLDHEVLLEIFRHRARRLAREVHGLAKVAEKEGKSRLEVENLYALPLQVAGRAHIEVFILSESMKQLALLPTSTPDTIKVALNILVSLFGLTTIAGTHSPFSASFLGDGYLTNSHLAEMREQIDILVKSLLPDAIALTDAWCFSDGTLASAIGCADGDVYTRLMTWTKQLPINVEAQKNGGVFKKGWEESIEPFLERDLGRLNMQPKL